MGFSSAHDQPHPGQYTGPGAAGAERGSFQVRKLNYGLKGTYRTNDITCTCKIPLPLSWSLPCPTYFSDLSSSLHVSLAVWPYVAFQVEAMTGMC